jgi:hypothetical protein
MFIYTRVLCEFYWLLNFPTLLFQQSFTFSRGLKLVGSQIQVISGVNFVSYWFSTWIWAPWPP